MLRISSIAGVLVAMLAAGGISPVSAAQSSPVPRPFPTAGDRPTVPAGAQPEAPAPQRPIVTPAPPMAQSGAPTDAMLGAPGLIPASARFLEVFDIGRAQHCYLFGTNAPFAELVAYYKQVLKDGGRELFKAPAMQQFDLGKFQEQTMTYPPSVVVKDYAAGGDGYLYVNGTKEERFKSIIQIVPNPGR